MSARPCFVARLNAATCHLSSAFVLRRDEHTASRKGTPCLLGCHGSCYGRRVCGFYQQRSESVHVLGSCCYNQRVCGCLKAKTVLCVQCKVNRSVSCFPFCVCVVVTRQLQVTTHSAVMFGLHNLAASSFAVLDALRLRPELRFATRTSWKSRLAVKARPDRGTTIYSAGLCFRQRWSLVLSLAKSLAPLAIVDLPFLFQCGVCPCSSCSYAGPRPCEVCVSVKDSACCVCVCVCLRACVRLCLFLKQDNATNELR